LSNFEIIHDKISFEMAALRSPFYGENLNLILLRQKIEALEYTPLPTNFYSSEVTISLIYFIFIIVFVC
jgi:hypothetical protein